QLLVLVVHLRPHWDANLRVLPRRTVLQRPASRLAPSGREPTPSAERGKVAQIRIGDEHDVTAGPAVTPVGTTLRHVLLTPERQAALTPAGRRRGPPARGWGRGH